VNRSAGCLTCLYRRLPSLRGSERSGASLGETRTQARLPAIQSRKAGRYGPVPGHHLRTYYFNAVGFGVSSLPSMESIQ
jgi:hypothetical protein